MTINSCLFFITLATLLQACSLSLHSGKHLYRILKAEEITKVTVLYNDSVNARNLIEFALNKNDPYFNNEQFKRALEELLTGNEKAAFSKLIANRPYARLKRYRQELSLTLSREKDWCDILPYSASVKFLSATKGDGIVTIGHMGSPVIYSEYQYLTNIKDINKLIAFANVLGRHYNGTTDSAGKRKMPSLPLLE